MIVSVGIFYAMVRGLYLYWLLYLSVQTLGPREVGIRLHRGAPEPRLYVEGSVQVPWCPINIGGRPLYELGRIPTILLKLKYEGTAEKMYSLDRQLLDPEFTVYVRFPYLHIESLIRLIKAGVPLTESELKEWMEDIIFPALRKVLGRRNHEDVITSDENATVNKDTINREVNDILRDPDGILMSTGLFGVDADDDTLGFGQVYLELEEVILTDELQKKHQSVGTVKLDTKIAQQEVLIAKERAKGDEAMAGDPLLIAMQKWVKSHKKPKESLAEATERLVASGEYARHETLVNSQLLARNGNLQVERSELGSPDGSPLPQSLQYLSVGGGGGAGVMFRGKGKKRNNSKGGGQKKGNNGGGADDDDDLDDPDA